MRSRSGLIRSLLQCLAGVQPLSRRGGLCASMPAYHRRNCIPTPYARPKARSFHGGVAEELQNSKAGGHNAAMMMAERVAAERGACRDTLLSSPGALSADSETERLFISDTDHHRIIIADASGRVVDSIGSSPGNKDGTFETAQLQCPASTAFDVIQKVLYIADSENHAIRRADLGRRVLDTLHPPRLPAPKLSLWERWLRWVGIARSAASEREDKMEAGPECSDPLRHPWHLRLTREGWLVTATDRFQSMWVLDSASGKVLDFQNQASEILFERFLGKVIDPKEVGDGKSWLLPLDMAGTALDVLPRADECPRVVSRVSTLQSKLIFVDTDAQVIRDFEPNSGTTGTVRLSNLGLLGLPWWWTLTSPNLQFADPEGRTEEDSGRQETLRRCHQIHIRPGRCLLCIEPVVPQGMALATPLGDGSIWRQARGSVVELSMLDGSLAAHRVSGAQLWLDDLDDLDSDGDDEAGELTLPRPSELGIPLYALVDASLGAGEVTVDAVVYLEFCESHDSGRSQRGMNLEKSLPNREGQIFLKHMHVRVQIEVAATSPAERVHHVTVQL